MSKYKKDNKEEGTGARASLQMKSLIQAEMNKTGRWQFFLEKGAIMKKGGKTIVLKNPVEDMDKYETKYVKEYQKTLNDSFVFGDRTVVGNKQYFLPISFWKHIEA